MNFNWNNYKFTGEQINDVVKFYVSLNLRILKGYLGALRCRDNAAYNY